MSDIHSGHKKIFILIFKVNLVVFVAELAAGLYSGSLTMISDSLHVSIHILAPLIAYISETSFYNLPPKVIKRGTALINILLFFVLAFGIMHEAIRRLSNPPEIDIGFIFFTVAVLGLAANIYNAWILNAVEDDECSDNIKPLFWHMLFDGIGSVIVLIGAIAIYFSDLYYIDPVLSITLALFIAVSGLVMLGSLIYNKNIGHNHHH